MNPVIGLARNELDLSTQEIDGNAQKYIAELEKLKLTVHVVPDKDTELVSVTVRQKKKRISRVTGSGSLSILICFASYIAMRGK